MFILNYLLLFFVVVVVDVVVDVVIIFFARYKEFKIEIKVYTSFLFFFCRLEYIYIKSKKNIYLNKREIESSWSNKWGFLRFEGDFRALFNYKMIK